MGWPRKDSPKLSFNNIYSVKEDINEIYHVSVNTVEKDSIITDEVDGESIWKVSFNFNIPLRHIKRCYFRICYQRRIEWCTVCAEINAYMHGEYY